MNDIDFVEFGGLPKVGHAAHPACYPAKEPNGRRSGECQKQLVLEVSQCLK
jgi:hypothetical protein